MNVADQLTKYKEILEISKQKAQSAKEDRIRYEATLEQLKKQESDLLEKVKKMGYDPDDLENIIADKIEKLKVITDKLDKIMNIDKSNTALITEDAYSILGIKSDVIINDIENSQNSDEDSNEEKFIDFNLDEDFPL